MERYEPMAAVKPSTGLRLTYRSLYINAYLTLHWNPYPDTPPRDNRSLGIILAGEPGGDDVDRRDARPVDGADVAKVRDAREPRGEDGLGVPVGFGVPDELSAEDGVDGEVEAAVAGAQRPDPQALRAGSGRRMM